MGDIDETELDRLNREINIKAAEWAQEGFHPNENFIIDPFLQSTRIDVIVEILIEELGLSVEEWAIKLAEKLLSNLTEALELLKEQKKTMDKPQVDIFRSFPPAGNDGGFH